MIWEDRYIDIIKSEETIRKEQKEKGYEIAITNNIIDDIRIAAVAHFANAITLTIQCVDCSLLGNFAITDNIGYILRFLVDLFDKNNDDGTNIKLLKNTPIRLIHSNNEYGKIIAIGHFMKNCFVYLDDIAKLKK